MSLVERHVANKVSSASEGGIALHEEDVVDLLARALAECQSAELGFCDRAASEIAEALDIDVAHRLEDPSPLRRSLATTMLVDGVVRRFFEKHPDGIAIGFHQGLCTRFSRVDNGRLRWVDVDLPAVAEFKSTLVPSSERRKFSAACSGRCTKWLESLGCAGDMPTIIVAQRSLCRADGDDVSALLLQASRYLPPGTELVLDYDVRLPLRASRTRALACLEIPTHAGTIERFPRLRFVSPDEYPIELAHDMRGNNGVSRLFRGRGVRSVAHLRFV